MPFLRTGYRTFIKIHCKIHILSCSSKKLDRINNVIFILDYQGNVMDSQKLSFQIALFMSIRHTDNLHLILNYHLSTNSKNPLGIVLGIHLHFIHETLHLCMDIHVRSSHYNDTIHIQHTLKLKYESTLLFFISGKRSQFNDTDFYFLWGIQCWQNPEIKDKKACTQPNSEINLLILC